LEQKFESLGVKTCADLQKMPRLELQQLCGSFGAELYDLCRGIDHRAVEPDRPRKSLSTEETFASDLITLPECEEQTGHLVEELLAELAEKEPTRKVTKAFVKLKFSDFTRTTIERAGAELTLPSYLALLAEAYARTNKRVRLIGVGVRFAEANEEAETQLPLL
jgi:DNA polymerase-4